MQIGSAINSIKNDLKTQYVLLAFITLLAAGLRFYKLSEWSFWIDEIFTINRATIIYGSIQSTLQNLPPNFKWTPISVLLTSAVVQYFGIDEWSARLVSAIIGIASIPVLYFPIKSMFGKGIALVAVLLLAISPWHVFWSQNARFYTSILLLYTLALFAFYFGLERDRARYIFLGYLFLYLAISERLVALLLIPIMMTYVGLLWLSPSLRPKGFNRNNLVVFFVPIVLVLLNQIINNLFISADSTSTGFEWFFLYRNYTPARLLGVIMFNIGPALMAIASFGGLFLIFERSRPGILLILSAVIPFIFVVPLSLIMFTEDRYVFVTLTSWIILAAVAIHGLWPKVWDKRMILSIGVLAILIANAMGDNLLYYRVNEGNRRDWKSAFSLVHERAQESDTVVAYWPEFGPYYYLDREIVAWDDITYQDVEESSNRIWFIVDSETVWGDLRKKAWIEKNAELIEVLYLRTPQDQNIRIYLYDPE
jgi:mannosyltransferase